MNPFSKNMIDRMFKQVDGVVWDLMSGSKIGIKTKEGIATCDLGLDETAVIPVKKAPARKTAATAAGALEVPEAVPAGAPLEAPDAQISINMFEDFGMAVPAFAQATPVSAISLGDMIYSPTQDKLQGWIVKRNASGKSFKILKVDGTRTEWSPPKVNMLGFDAGGVMVVRSLMNMLPGGAAGQNGLEGMQNGMMQMMMMSSMMGGDEGDSEGMMKDIMPMLLMSSMGTPGGGGNAMANMLPMMMMGKMMGGKKGGLFGGSSSSESKDSRGGRFFDDRRS